MFYRVAWVDERGKGTKTVQAADIVVRDENIAGGVVKCTDEFLSGYLMNPTQLTSLRMLDEDGKGYKQIRVVGWCGKHKADIPFFLTFVCNNMELTLHFIIQFEYKPLF